MTCSFARRLWQWLESQGAVRCGQFELERGPLTYRFGREHGMATLESEEFDRSKEDVDDCVDLDLLSFKREREQVQQELTQARDFQYPKHWDAEERDHHRSRIEKLEVRLELLDYNISMIVDEAEALEAMVTE